MIVVVPLGKLDDEATGGAVTTGGATVIKVVVPLGSGATLEGGALMVMKVVVPLGRGATLEGVSPIVIKVVVPLGRAEATCEDTTATGG